MGVEERYVVDVEMVDSKHRYILRDTYNQYQIIHKEEFFNIFNYEDDGHRNIKFMCKQMNREYRWYNKELMELGCWPHYNGE